MTSHHAQPDATERPRNVLTGILSPASMAALVQRTDAYHSLPEPEHLDPARLREWVNERIEIDRQWDLVRDALIDLVLDRHS